MRVRSVHPGVGLDEVLAQTSFPLVTEEVGTTREPSAAELELLRTRLDPDGRREKEVPS
jgi:hypothetical protein